MIEFLFAGSLFMLFYIHIGYPILVAMIGYVGNRTIVKREISPSVTVLIAAYNEQDSIRATIQNKLDQEYPANLIEIIVISDGSNDRTDEIVLSFNDARVKLIRQYPRQGKTCALNLAAPRANGDIIVFSDANSIYEKDAIRMLIRNFADPKVGYVTGQMIYVDHKGSPTAKGCGRYMQYENFLRSMETRIGSVVGVDGGIDAVRKSLYQEMAPDQLPDLVLPLKVIEQGYRVVYEPAAFLTEPALKTSGDEYKMRVRVALRAMWALFCMRDLLWMDSNRLFSWQLWSHKVLRYLCFIFLFSSWTLNALLLEKGMFFLLFFIIQNFAYFLAIASPVWELKWLKYNFGAYCRYFALIHIAAAHGFAKFMLGQKQIVWIPRKG
jgi:cellulose synthase/poly-beta-1,6-N-acetylglucosamine synthase-like glycosyltransferase